jgi:hypothetical protein
MEWLPPYKSAPTESAAKRRLVKRRAESFAIRTAIRLANPTVNTDCKSVLCSRYVTSCVVSRLVHFARGSFGFEREKNLSMTALSQTLPERLRAGMRDKGYMKSASHLG